MEVEISTTVCNTCSISCRHMKVQDSVFLHGVCVNEVEGLSWHDELWHTQVPVITGTYLPPETYQRIAVLVLQCM